MFPTAPFISYRLTKQTTNLWPISPVPHLPPNPATQLLGKKNFTPNLQSTGEP